MDFTLNQAGHGDHLIKASDYFDYLAAHDDKPFVEGEASYEFCSTLEEMGTRLCTADMLRRVAYICMQVGGAGYTYEAQGIWASVWESPEEPDPFMAIFNRFGITWAQAVGGEGAVWAAAREGPALGKGLSLHFETRWWGRMRGRINVDFDRSRRKNVHSAECQLTQGGFCACIE